MIEYAVTAGEGTLLAYGVADAADVCEGENDYGGVTVSIWTMDCRFVEEYDGATLIARPCSEDCETGK